MENRAVRQLIKEKGKTEICAGRDEEWVLIGKAGHIRGTVLPGSSRSFVLEEGDRLLGIHRHAVLSDVVGCGHMMDPDGNAWGSWFRFSLRLLSPRRYALMLDENALQEDELSSFKTETRRAMAEIFTGMLGDNPTFPEGSAEKTYVQKVRAFFEGAAERYGLEVLDFVPGGVRRLGGA